MRISITIIIVLATLGFLAGVASAGKVKLEGTYSAEDIRKTCADNDGIYSEGGGVYGCSKECGNTICNVSCQDGQCTGECPKCGRVEPDLPELGGVGVVGNILKNSVEEPSKPSKQ